MKLELKMNLEVGGQPELKHIKKKLTHKKVGLWYILHYV